jgi:hypothetical protein
MRLIATDALIGHKISFDTIYTCVLGKLVFVHRPEAFTFPNAFERFVKACHPGKNKMRVKLWQAQLI